MSTTTPAPRGRTRRTDTPAGKLLAAGLAGATCIGLVGVIGIRSATDAAANAAANGDQAASDLAAADAIEAGTADLASSVSTDGLTRAQLDDYAAQLAAERQRLIDYRAYLVDVAAQLQAVADGSGAVVSQASVTSGRKKPAATGSAAQPRAPKAQQAPKAQPKPKAHAQTEGS